ncbi:TIGR02466 family protein [Cognatiyoonia sp. IB215182]|uniref:TIGR02466 family protein n=1 Tax=Cognatiyoonia sp. IB215182 TaxID=3097353 RepID=UPI002A136C5F|nr:TIGR02466 family protein [Cognatiyoonia sp. IB215182]MDX8352562.1 TIGR02466 family protein [Cognatiyoonia sp. IB215182]
MNVQNDVAQQAEFAAIPDRIEMSENLYFPTQIFSFQLPSDYLDDANAMLLDAISAERAKDAKGIQRSNFRGLGGWHSHNHLHNEAPYQPLVQLIGSACCFISERNGYHKGATLEIGTMWSIVNPPGSSNRAHIHPGSLWSGVYYVQTPEDCGDIEFIDPRTENLVRPARHQPNKKRPRTCWTKVNFTPTAGKMLIFPSWLYHGVSPNLTTQKGSAGERVIISFNLNQIKTKSHAS